MTIHVGVDATTWWNDRGFGRFTRELMTALLARDNGRIRYTLVVDREPNGALPEGANVLSAQSSKNLDESAVGSGARSPAYLARLATALWRARFDVFFFPAVYSYFPLPLRIPTVVCFHDTTAERFPRLIFPTKRNQRLWDLKTKMALAQTTRAMTISASSARDVEQILKVPRNRIDVITEGADPIFRPTDDEAAIAAARAELNIPADRDLLVYVGGMNPHKNLMRLLEAMPRIVDKRNDVHLAIVGSTSGKGFWDDVPSLMRFVETHPPLSEHVTFTGYLPDEDLVRLFGSTAALVFPSLWEGFGLPAVEAMACRVPVLASDRSSLPEVIGDTGRFFDPHSPRDIARCVLEFLADDEARQTLPERALERTKRFTWDRAAELAEACLLRCHEDGR